jgi:UDP-N-acetylmuramoyl-tripeptide--D-alanyl-D-alanine ligase
MFMKKILILILKNISKGIIWRHRPIIIAITGSVGKTSVRDAIFAVISRRFAVRKSVKNYNNEIGVPLSIIGVKGDRGLFGYVGAVLKGLYLCFFGVKNFPKFLVLEMGADKPGDIKYLAGFIKPHIAVVTAIGEMPVHIEFFPERDALIKEKMNLLEALPKDGIAILNYDDLSVRDMRSVLTDKNVLLTYGFGSGAMVKGDNYEIRGLEEKDSIDRSLYMNFKVEFGGSIIPVRIPNLLGSSQAYATLAASAVALSLGINLLEISEGLRGYHSPAGRMKLIKGIKNSWIIDDTYNSSPLAVDAALDTLAKFDKYRKIAVLGDMMELGQFMEDAHRLTGKRAAEACDLIIAVGQRARFIYDEAVMSGFSKDNIFYFDHHQLTEAGELLQGKIKTNDVVLVKGSQYMRMEKIVKEVMAEPELAGDLLVRQDWSDA